MNTSSRFAVATHVLTLLTLHREEPLTSEYIAGSVNTNPVVIRRVLGELRVAGLVISQGGNGGGWWISGDPDAITLRDVYRAVERGAVPSPSSTTQSGVPRGAEHPAGAHQAYR